MRYFLAIVLPPVAVLFCGRPMAALLNLLLTLCFYLPGAVHALIVVGSAEGARRHREIVGTLNRATYHPAHARR